MMGIMNSRNDCVYCGLPFVEEDAMRKKTRDRKDPKGGYTVENVVLACYRCNVVKNSVITYEEMLILGPIIRDLIENRPATN
jgi:5-methylcytosine-specific restriction endonuclease McrA